MAYENTGYLAFANALNNAGQTFGNAIQERQRRQYLSDLSPFMQSGDMAGAAKAAFDMGDQDLGVKFALLDQEKRKIAEQRAFDSQALSGIDSVGAGAAPAGVSGGVTQNPNPQPQPMQLPGATSDASLPRGMRNQNPGNIEDGPFARSQPGYVGNDGRFAKFDTMEHGVGAQASLLGSYANKGINTISGIINRYAPQAENGKATQNYAAFVARKIGVDPNAPLDLSDPAMRQKVALVMSEFENGRPVLGGPAKPGVQVADASGAVPASAIPQQPQQPQAASPVDGLMARRQNILRALSQQGISDNARSQLSTLLKDTEFQIDRFDKQTTNNSGAKVQQEVEQRIILGQKYGLSGDALQAFGLTGKLPKEDQSLTAGDREAIRTADEGIQSAQNVISSLTQAKDLSKTAFGFPGAPMAAKAGSLFGNDTAIATAELDNLINGQALDSLRAVFGGNPTEGERKILLDIQGSSSQPDAVRQKIFDRAITAAQKRLQFNQDRATELRGGTYYKPRGNDSANPTASPIDQARAAIAAGADRAKVIERLRANKVDPSGL